MTLAKCRECNADVSDLAKICPKCGVTKPVKKMSFLAKLFLGFLGFAIFGNIVGEIVGGSLTKNRQEVENIVRKLEPKEEALNAVKIEKIQWHKGGFSTVMLLSVKIKNASKWDVKDIQVDCTHTANSGTRIDKNQKIIFEKIGAGKSLSIKDFNMGFIHSQASSTSCSVTDLVVL